MDTYTWMITHCEDLLLFAGLIVCLSAAVAGVVYGCALLIRIANWAGKWRVRNLQQSQQALAISLDMKTRRRAYKETSTSDELARLRTDAAAAVKHLAELRRLHAAQDELLAARAARVADLEGELATNRSAHRSAQDDCERGKAEAAALTEQVQTLTGELQHRNTELGNRDQIIRMLEAQLTSARKGADMANAGLSDHKAQLDLLRERLAASQSRCELLQQITDRHDERPSTDDNFLTDHQAKANATAARDV